MGVLFFEFPIVVLQVIDPYVFVQNLKFLVFRFTSHSNKKVVLLLSINILSLTLLCLFETLMPRMVDQEHKNKNNHTYKGI